MNSVATPQFLSALKQYAEDRMFESALLNVGRDFMKVTGSNALTGIRYVVLSLLVAQAMKNMLDGYSGSSSYDNNFLNEAIGFHLGSGPKLWGDPKLPPETVERYEELVKTVFDLQGHSRTFSASIEKLLFTYR